MKRLLFIPVMVIGLNSCGSFNNSFNHYALPAKSDLAKKDTDDDDSPKIDVTIPPTPQTVTPLVPPPPVSVVKNKCEVYPFVDFAKTPDVPYKEMQAANDVGTIEKIERKHINELREYIADIKRQQKKRQAQFYEKCEAVGK